MDTPRDKHGVALRSTQFRSGKPEGASLDTKSAEIRSERRRAGRPLGSKNKPKGLFPAELASDFLGVIKDILPHEYYEEMRGAIKDGKVISTVTEAKITLKLMGPAIWRRLIAEGKVDGTGDGKPFSRDLNERLKVYTSLMAFIEKVDNDEGESNRPQPIFEVFARRGMESDRIKVLVGLESSGMGGSTDGIGGEPALVGALSDTVSERQGYIQDSEQEPTVGIFDDYLVGDDT